MASTFTLHDKITKVTLDKLLIYFFTLFFLLCANRSEISETRVRVLCGQRKLLFENGDGHEEMLKCIIRLLC